MIINADARNIPLADGTVLDPFSGSGTTGRVAIRNRRKYVGLELNPEYITIQRERLTTEVRLI